MSQWSHIQGIVELDYESYDMNASLSFPVISGSERNARIVYCCEHKFHRAYVLLHGDLRDRTFEETLKETVSYLNRLSKRFFVTDVLVRVTNYDDEYIFNNPAWMFDNFEVITKEVDSNEH